MMGNAELAPEVDVSILEPLLSPDVVSELLNTYMSILTVSGAGRARPRGALSPARRPRAEGGGSDLSSVAFRGARGLVRGRRVF